MKTSSLDILENAHLPPEQAKAILPAMEGEFAEHQTQLATKSDLTVVREDFATFRADMRAEFISLTGIFAAITTVYTGMMAVLIHYLAAK